MLAQTRFFYGWYIVLCCFISQGVRAGLGNQTFGFFINPMIAELKWSRTMLTGALMTQSIIGAMLGPFVGFVVDRYGPRLLVVGGASMMGASMLLLSQTRNLWQFILFLGIIGTFGITGLSYGVTSPTIAKWFIRKRGRASGIATAGLNVGVAVFTPITLVLMDEFGWRMAWLYLGVLPLILVIPPALLWLHRQPEDMGLVPDGSPPPRQEDYPNPLEPLRESFPEEVSWSVQEAFRSKAFWQLFIAESLYGIAQGAVIIHRIPFIIDLGYSSQIAGASLMIHSLAAFFGKLVWGYLADRFDVKLLLLVVLLSSAAALSALFYADSSLQLYLGFSLFYGLTAGSLTVLGPLIWAQYFGRRHLGAIQGLMGPLRLVPGVVGPMYAAYVHDVTESYEIAFGSFVGLFIISACVVWRIRPPAL